MPVIGQVDESGCFLCFRSPRRSVSLPAAAPWRSMHVQPVAWKLVVATNLALDPALIERAVAVSGEPSKKAAVTLALKEFIARREQRRIAELLDRLEWDESFDPKAERSRK